MTGLRFLHFSSGVDVKTLKLNLKVTTLTTWSLFHFDSVHCAGGWRQNKGNVLESDTQDLQNTSICIYLS